MNWIKQNKFEAILLLVVIVLAGGIFLFGKSQAGNYGEALDRFERADSQVSNFERIAPYPEDERVASYREAVKAFQGSTADLQKRLLTFRPAEFKKTSPAAFTTRLNETSARLKALYDDKITYPEEWQAGFESYTGSPPKDQATAFLGYQLGAMEWILTELAKTRPSALLNVHRPQLPIELGQPMTPEQKGGGRNKPVDKPYFTLPVEVTFRGREASLRKFLATLAGSKDYFVSVRGIRVTSTNTSAPSEDDAEFERDAAAPKTGGSASPFDGFEGFDGFEDLPEEEEPEDPAAPAEEEVQEGTRILGQVLGGEELNVFLKLEILLFRDDTNLPELGK